VTELNVISLKKKYGGNGAKEQLKELSDCRKRMNASRCKFSDYLERFV